VRDGAALWLEVQQGIFICLSIAHLRLVSTFGSLCNL
jgi:hypothetical protein